MSWIKIRDFIVSMISQLNYNKIYNKIVRLFLINHF